MKKYKLKTAIIGFPVFLLTASIIYLLVFSAVGYMITIDFRGFTEIREKFYIDDDILGLETEMLLLFDKAKERLNDFFGDIKADPIIVISGDEKKLDHMGLNKSPCATNMFVLFGPHSYIALSSDSASVDIFAHELTHAELYARLYEGKLLSRVLIPMWFDEGLATQNDYRPQYSDESWARHTKDGKYVTRLDWMETAQAFASDNEGIRSHNYLISKHEVKTWLETHGKERLLELIESVKNGKDFFEIYYAD